MGKERAFCRNMLFLLSRSSTRCHGSREIWPGHSKPVLEEHIQECTTYIFVYATRWHTWYVYHWCYAYTCKVLSKHRLISTFNIAMKSSKVHCTFINKRIETLSDVQTCQVKEQIGHDMCQALSPRLVCIWVCFNGYCRVYITLNIIL